MKTKQFVSKPDTKKSKKIDPLLEHLLANGWKIAPKCEKTGELLWPTD